jgi:ribosomal protein S18 acetylase RimI-like enzyme
VPLTLTIRRASLSDARAIAHVHVETWRSAYAGILPDHVMVNMTVDGKASSWRAVIAQQGPRDTVLIARVSDGGSGDAVVGFASCGPLGGSRATSEGEVHTLYVLPDWHEQGVGRALLCACFRVLRAAGMTSAMVWVLAENPSRFFYQAMGSKAAAQREEALWGARLRQTAYHWPDLAALPESCRER